MGVSLSLVSMCIYLSISLSLSLSLFAHFNHLSGNPQLLLFSNGKVCMRSVRTDHPKTKFAKIFPVRPKFALQMGPV